MSERIDMDMGGLSTSPWALGTHVGTSREGDPQPHPPATRSVRLGGWPAHSAERRAFEESDELWM